MHGHTYNSNINDSRYANICVKNTNYLPVEFNSVKDIILTNTIHTRKGN